MQIYHFEKDSIGNIISGGCYYPMNVISTKIGSGLCINCSYNHNKNALNDKKIHCNRIKTSINAEYFWHEKKWLNEEEYNMRFISDDNI